MQCSMIDLHNHYIAFEAIDSTVGLMEQNGSGEGRTPVQTFPIRGIYTLSLLYLMDAIDVNNRRTI